MSIVTNLLGKLHFIGALQTQVTSFESKLNKIAARAPHIRFKLEREWSSPKGQRNFDAEQLARRTYVEAQGRVLVAR